MSDDMGDPVVPKMDYQIHPLLGSGYDQGFKAGQRQARAEVLAACRSKVMVRIHNAQCSGLPGDIQDVNLLSLVLRDLVRLQPAAKDLEELLEVARRKEREPMKCGHPKACLVREHFFLAMKPCDKPYDVYACEICGQQMHSHTDGGGTAWIMKEYCSACAKLEKARAEGKG